MKIMKFILNNWKRCVAFAAVFAFITGLYTTYNRYFTEQQVWSFVYSDAEKGRYPDGSKFEIYDLLSDRVLTMTLEKLNQEGKFLNRTVEDLRKCFSIRAHFSAPVQAKIQEARRKGQNYSYVPTEYVITASTAKNLPFLNLRHLFSENTTKELLNALKDTYYQYFLAEHTENNVLEKISAEPDYSQYDYPEIADSIENRLNLYLQYLQSKKAEDATFRSSVTGKSFHDLISSFENLLSIRANTYKSYVYASKISKDKETLIGVYEAQIEELQRKVNKKAAEAEIAGKAMEEYDHTFEESIVITGVDKNDEVYQVKPKTGYDFVTKQSLDAGVESSAFQEEIKDKRRRIEAYKKASLSPEETARISAVSDSMIEEITKEQMSLQQLAQQTVADYLTTKNSDYIKTKPIDKKYWNIGFWIKVSVAAAGGFLLALLYALLLWLKQKWIGHDGVESGESSGAEKKARTGRLSLRKKAKQEALPKPNGEKRGNKIPKKLPKKQKKIPQDAELYDAMKALETKLDGLSSSEQGKDSRRPENKQ